MTKSGLQGAEHFASEATGVYFVRTVPLLTGSGRNASGYVGSWNVIDICTDGDESTHVSCPSADVDYNVALAGSRSTHVDDALFVFGGTANKTQFTHPYESCNSTMGSAIASAMQVVLYTRSEASKYAFDAFGSFCPYPFFAMSVLLSHVSTKRCCVPLPYCAAHITLLVPP